MKRPEFPTEKGILVIADYPTINEEDQEIIFGSPSNINFITDLNRVGIKGKDISTTYLTYERPEIGNYTFKKSFCKKSDIDTIDGCFLVVDFLEVCMEKYLKDSFESLLEEIEKTKPKIIVIVGKLSLFLLTGAGTLGNTHTFSGGLDTYRSSILKLRENFIIEKCIVFPMLPTVTKQRLPKKVPIIMWDFKKLGDIWKKINCKERDLDFYLEQELDFRFSQNYNEIIDYLNTLIKILNKNLVCLSVDIETRADNIDCIGLLYKNTPATCIAFTTIDGNNLHSSREEAMIVIKLKKILEHRNCRIVGQNFFYDSAYLWDVWRIDAISYFDTMVAHHVLYNYMPKSLDILASIYCDNYTYWKGMQKHN